MNKNGPIIVIDDDLDDQFFMGEIFKKLGYPNEIIFFTDSLDALEFLTTSKQKPFLILSDINMPKLNGMDLREKIYVDEQLNLKCIPYLFFSTAASQKIIVEAYSKSVQGFFVKPPSQAALEKTISKIIEYWKECEAPNYVE